MVLVGKLMVIVTVLDPRGIFRIFWQIIGKKTLWWKAHLVDMIHERLSRVAIRPDHKTSCSALIIIIIII